MVYRNISRILQKVSLCDNQQMFMRTCKINPWSWLLVNNGHTTFCRMLFWRNFQSSAKTEEKVEYKQRSVSLIAKQLFESQQKSEPEYKVEIDKKENIKDVNSKLTNLAQEMSSDFDHESKEENNTSFSASRTEKNSLVSDYQSKVFRQLGAEDSIEDIVFKQDLESQPKPSPLLGTEDRHVPISDVPCVGCGALLHCQHRTAPGFLPSERFKLLSQSELKSSICQRCYYIQHCDAFMEVTTSAEDYAQIISEIRRTRSVVVMVIDVMDIHGSIIPNLADYIGHKHPLIIVGNKVDLIAPDCREYLTSLKKSITDACNSAKLRNIRDVTLISAKTGFGIERLITLLLSFHKHKADVYIVGTANAGKSSLFNTLLASDYCRQRARDLIQRATVSVWPGTTLNLLKFPIMRSTPRTMALRHRRLTQEKALRKELLKQAKNKDKKEKWQLREDIAVTDMRTQAQIEKDNAGTPWGQEVFAYKAGRDGVLTTASTKDSTLTPDTFDSSHYEHSYWVYDTPGVINPNQTFNLLESDECSLLQPVDAMTPRCLIMKPGTTVFISGMARLDYIQGDEALMTTVHCAPDVPIRLVSTDEADQYYLQNAGSAELGIPLGDKERLDRLPALVARTIELEGKDDTMAVADVQLSSIGWVSIAPRSGCRVQLRAFTPGSKGIHLRCPSLLPRFMHFKGKKIKGTPFFWPRQIGISTKSSQMSLNAI